MRLYDSKNGEGRVVPLMSNVFPLLAALCAGKNQNEFDGSPVKDFRCAWQNMWIRADVPCSDGSMSRLVCGKCGSPMDAGTKICSVKTRDEDGYERKCGGERRYTGLLVHDMRRSAAKRLRESGIHEKLIMDVGGWKTRRMFDRYTITDPESMRRAMEAVTAPEQPSIHQTASTSLQANTAGKMALQ